MNRENQDLAHLSKLRHFQISIPFHFPFLWIFGQKLTHKIQLKKNYADLSDQLREFFGAQKIYSTLVRIGDLLARAQMAFGYWSRLPPSVQNSLKEKKAR